MKGRLLKVFPRELYLLLHFSLLFYL